MMTYKVIAGKAYLILKKIRTNANILAGLLNQKIQAHDLPDIVSQLSNACSNLSDSIMLQNKWHYEVENFDWLIGQTINAIDGYTDEDDDEAILQTNDSPIHIDIHTYPCDECDEGYAKIINLKDIVYPGHEIIDVIQTRIKEDDNYYSDEITVQYDDKKYKSFIYDRYLHDFECSDGDVFGYIDIQF